LDVMADSRARFIASIERLTKLLLDRLDESPSGKLMDEKETRMLGSVMMRPFKIWEKALTGGPLDQKALERLGQFKRVIETAEKES
jgi:hypothetical protein